MTTSVLALLDLVRMMQSELIELTSNASESEDVGKDFEGCLEPADLAHNIYSLCENTNDLLIKNIITLEKRTQTLKNFIFTDGCQYAILEPGTLLLTGGFPAKRDVVQISSDFSHTYRNCMITGRRRHGLAHLKGKVYAVSGWGAGQKCERYDCESDIWEELPDIPKGTGCITPILTSNSLYVLGGYAGTFLDDVQVLDIPSNTWSVLDIRLPTLGWYMPCFTACRDEVFFIVKKQLWTLTHEKVAMVKKLDDDIQCCGGPCIFDGDTLHCSYNLRYTPQVKLGHLGWASKRNVLWVLDNKLRRPLYREVVRYL